MELAVTLSLAGAVIALGAPNFIEFRNNNRLTSAANEFLGAALTARTEALKRRSRSVRRTTRKIRMRNVQTARSPAGSCLPMRTTIACETTARTSCDPSRHSKTR